MEPKGTIVKIQRFSLHDGPGIRSTIFLKGCPLRCLWCANPETQESSPSLRINSMLCIGCASCVEVCPRSAIVMENRKSVIQRESCQNCFLCAGACPAGALSVDGYEVTVEQALRELLKDRRFYRISGGVTISGGEPLFQPDFTFSLVKKLKNEGIHVILDTCGYAKWSDFEKLLPYVDAFYYDLKQMDSKKHRELTGVSNEVILDNLRRLSGSGANVSLRFPIIPGCNDDPENLRLMSKLIQSLDGRPELWLLPYHRFGVGKYEQMQKVYPLPEIEPPSSQKTEEIREFFSKEGIFPKNQ